MDDDYDEIYGDSGGGGEYGAPPPPPQQQQTQVPQHAQPQQHAAGIAPGPPPGGPADDDDADDFLVTLNEPSQPANANANADAEDDFEVQLDEADAPSGPPAAAPPAGAFRYTRPGAPQQPQARPEAPRPYMDAAASAAQPVGPWAGGGGRGGPGGGRGMGTRPWRPQFIPLSATALERDDTLAFPEAAKAGQPIKLPGQTRVTPDEYHEFITLGQGGVFELDLDRVVDAPWKVPGVETSAFFNYSLTSAKWRAYIREIQQAHAESRMQGRIQLYEPASAGARDPDMPAELAAAYSSKGLVGSQFGLRPPSAGQSTRQDAADAVMRLAGNYQFS